MLLPANIRSEFTCALALVLTCTLGSACADSSSGAPPPPAKKDGADATKAAEDSEDAEAKEIADRKKKEKKEKEKAEKKAAAEKKDKEAKEEAARLGLPPPPPTAVEEVKEEDKDKDTDKDEEPKAPEPPPKPTIDDLRLDVGFSGDFKQDAKAKTVIKSGVIFDREAASGAGAPSKIKVALIRCDSVETVAGQFSDAIKAQILAQFQTGGNFADYVIDQCGDCVPPGGVNANGQDDPICKSRDGKAQCGTKLFIMKAGDPDADIPVAPIFKSLVIPIRPFQDTKCGAAAPAAGAATAGAATAGAATAGAATAGAGAAGGAGAGAAGGAGAGAAN